MNDDIIGMREMAAIFQVTDAMGIHREQVSVPLEKRDPGEVRRLPSGEVEIVVPLTIPIADWEGALRASLEDMGFTFVDEEAEDEDFP